MSEPGQRETTDQRVNTTEGHYVRWEISARDLSVVREWIYMRKFRTGCRAAKTAWDFKMCFPEVKEDGSSSLSIVLTRSDALDGVGMDAVLLVDVCDSNKNEIFRRKKFVRTGLMPSSHVTETVQLVPNLNMGEAVKHKLVIVVTLLVSSCHPKSPEKDSNGVVH